jgi:endonuclease G
MALPRRVKVKKATRKKTAQTTKRSTKKSNTKKMNNGNFPWRIVGVLVALVASIGSFFALGGNVDNFTSFFNTAEPTTTNEDPEQPTEALEDYLPTRVLGDKFIEHKYYALSYSTKHKNPEWVAYELSSRRVNLDKAERRSNFISDPNAENTAKDNDYQGSGYDRGHLAPAEDMNFSATAMDESFYLTNISPQFPDFNRGVWKKLENHVRKWAVTHKAIYVITGPILPKRVDSRTKTIGDGVVVPSKFYKVILDYSDPEKKGIAFILSNEKSDAPLIHFACSIRKVEEQTGIDFFPKLSKSESNALEGSFDVTKWELD